MRIYFYFSSQFGAHKICFFLFVCANICEFIYEFAFLKKLACQFVVVFAVVSPKKWVKCCV